MKKYLKRISALLLAAVMLLCCTGCEGGGQSEPYDSIPESTGGKDIERAEAADNVFSLNSNSNYSMNPLIATNHSNQLVCSLVFENMLEVDNDFVAHKNVIIDWVPSDDFKLWTFKLDPENPHTFHDGSRVTSRDLSYSLNAAIYADRYKGRFSNYQGASCPSENELQVSLGVGDSQFYKLMNIPIVKTGTYGEKFPIGSGPYTYNEDGTALIAYEGYAGYESLPVDKIYLKEYPTAEGTISAFEDSLIDIVINDPSSYTNLGYASTNEVHTFSTTNMHYVAFNEQSALGKYNYFRVAMQYAFDREYLVELLHGNGVDSPIPMYPTCAEYPQYMADSLNYDLETCKTVLENAGIKDYDNDGRLEYMSGSPQEINLNFIVSSDSSAKGGVARRFAEDMNSIGLTVTVRELTWDNYIKALEEGDFDMYYGEVRLRNNFDLTELLQVRTKDNESTNLNFTNSKDASFDTYIKAYLAAGDTGRAIAYQNLCEYITASTGSLITIGFEKQQIISHRGVIKGIDTNFGNPLYGFANWEIMMD